MNNESNIANKPKSLEIHATQTLKPHTHITKEKSTADSNATARDHFMWVNKTIGYYTDKTSLQYQTLTYTYKHNLLMSASNQCFSVEPSRTSC